MNYSETKNMVDLAAAIQDCLQAQRVLPCLILPYSGIEIVAKMGCRPERRRRAISSGGWILQWASPIPDK
jgi:hypothetical protein